MPTTTDPIAELSRSLIADFAGKFHEDLGVADAYEGRTEMLFSLLVEVAGAYVDALGAEYEGRLSAEALIGSAVEGLSENLEIRYADELAR